MQPGGTPSKVWQRRTHRLVAATIIVIGLTMMVSNISQCIYMGMVFIMLALIRLAWMAVKERKVEPSAPHGHQSPVLFLVTSHIRSDTSRINPGSPLDKPPSYDTVVTLDGLPPDYSSVQFEKPPRYEDIAALYKAASNSEYASQDATPGPSGITKLQKAEQDREGVSACKEEVFSRSLHLGDSYDAEQSAEGINCNMECENSKVDVLENPVREVGSTNLRVQNSHQENCERSSTRMSRLQPMRTSLSRSFRGGRDLQRVHRDRKRNASGSDSGNSETKFDRTLNSARSLLRLQVPTLHQDTAGCTSKYLECPDPTSYDLPCVHSQRHPSAKSRTLPNTRTECEMAPSESGSDVNSAARSKDHDHRDSMSVDAIEISLSEDPQLLHSSHKV